MNAAANLSALCSPVRGIRAEQRGQLSQQEATTT
jgi:hypothetical protein